MQNLPRVPFDELARTLVGSVVAGVVLLLVAAVFFSSPAGTEIFAEEESSETATPGATGPQGGAEGTTTEGQSGPGQAGSGGTGAAGAPGASSGGGGASGDQGTGGAGSPAGTGRIKGQVVDATTGRAIQGATVAVRGTLISAKSDQTGSYQLTVPPGDQTVVVSQEGYITLEEKMKVEPGLVSAGYFTLSPKLKAGEMRIVLTWKEKPQDMDAHLWLPTTNKSHVYYISERRGEFGSFPFAKLDVDAKEGRGPETITIGKLFEGEYIYAVNQFSSDGALGGSGATVRVYGGSSLLETFVAPAGEGRWWRVFTINGNTGAIKSENKIIKENPEPYPF